MDTLRDKNLLENLWSNQKAPWKICEINKQFWKNKSVFLTGHTGFKEVGLHYGSNQWVNLVISY